MSTKQQQDDYEMVSALWHQAARYRELLRQVDSPYHAQLDCLLKAIASGHVLERIKGE